MCCFESVNRFERRKIVQKTLERNDEETPLESDKGLIQGEFYYRFSRCKFHSFPAERVV